VLHRTLDELSRPLRASYACLGVSCAPEAAGLVPQSARRARLLLLRDEDHQGEPCLAPGCRRRSSPRLGLMILIYLGLVEFMKRLFYGTPSITAHIYRPEAATEAPVTQTH